MNEKRITSLLSMLLILAFASLNAHAQMFDVDASDFDSQTKDNHYKHAPADPLDDPDNVERFLDKFREISGRIVGGEDVDIEDYPWQVSLQLQPQYGGSHFCGGTIVNEEWVITASHCLVFEDENGDDLFLDPSHFHIKAGFTDMSSGQGSFYNLEEVIMHPDYDPGGNLQYDIALLRLAQPFNFEHPGKKPVNLVSQKDADEGLTDPGEMVKVSGWGALSHGGDAPDILQAIEVPIRDIDDTAYPPNQITDDMIIAGDDGMDSCQGDSGGPMVVPDGHGWYKLAGVVSHGVQCGLPQYPGVYARVSYFEDWLATHIEFPDPNQYYTFHYETFGDEEVPEGWENVVIEGPEEFPGWEWTETGGSYGGELNSTTADDGYMILDSDEHGEQGTPEEADLISKAFDFSDVSSNISFSLEHRARTFGNADIGIYISTDDFEAQTELYRWHDAEQNDFNGDNPVHSEFDITDIVQEESNVKIKFKWIGEYDYWWLVDDFKILVENPPLDIDFIVTDGEEPLPGVNISTPYDNQEDITGDDGMANITLYEGDYDLSLRKTGYFPKDTTVTITEDGQLVEIAMEKIPAPEIVVDTDNIDLTLPQGNTENIMVNIANPGDLDLEYALFAYPSDGNRITETSPAETVAGYDGYDVSPGTEIGSAYPGVARPDQDNLQRERKDSDFEETIEIHHDNGYGNNGVGTGGEVSFMTAARFMAEDLAPYYASYKLSAVKYHIRSDDFSEVSIKIWEGGSEEGPAAEIYSADITDEVLIDEWSTHILPEQIQLEPGAEYWIGYAMDATDDFPASVDSGPMVEGKGAWMYFNGDWQELTDLGELDYNWCIRGILQLGEQVEWLTFDPDEGIVAPEDDTDVELAFDAADLEVGEHYAQAIIQNNAGDNISIPVTFNVTPPEYNITFTITDENGNAVDDAIVTLGDMTNEAGDYLFEDVQVGDYTYEVSKTGHQTAEGMISLIDEDIMAEVVLPSDGTDTSTLTVTVEDEFGESVEEAYFYLQGFGGHYTNASGQTEVQVVPGTYDYHVNKTGFEQYTGEVTITADDEQDLDVTLTYLRFDVTLSVNLDEAGNVTGGGEYYYGEEATISATPDTGYHFLNWVEDGSEITNEESYTFAVTSDRDFLAVFDINTYIIEATAGDNGSITPSGEVEVDHGSDITFTINPVPGYYIDNVDVDGESIGTPEEYTFENVTADGHTIHATFDIHTYDVEISAEGNGTVEPEGMVTVDHGEDVIITFTPDEEHHLADIQVNGESVDQEEVVNEFLLIDITSDMTVHGIFDYSTSIDIVEDHPELQIYPNPAQDYVTVSADERIMNIRLFNTIGQKMIHVNADGYEEVIDLSGLQNGMYLLQVQFRNTTSTVTLSVQ